MSNRLPIAIVVGIAVIAFSEQATASCAFQLAPVQFENADAVFTGILDDVRDHAPVGPYQRVLEYEFTVTHSWKGNQTVGGTVRVVACSPNDAECSYDFRRGAHYVVYACNFQDVLFTSNCAHNNPVELALWEQYCLFPSLSRRDDRDLPNATMTDLFSYLNSDRDELAYEAVFALCSIDCHRGTIIRGLTRIIRDERGHFEPTSDLYFSGEAGRSFWATQALQIMRPASSGCIMDLIRTTESNSNIARCASISVLSQILDASEYYPYLMDALADDDRVVRFTAVELTPGLQGKFGAEERRALLDNVIKLLSDEFLMIRTAAISAVAAFGEPEIAIPVLENVAEHDDNQQVRWHARQAAERLARMTEQRNIKEKGSN